LRRADVTDLLFALSFYLETPAIFPFFFLLTSPWMSLLE
jgi:hypothetical protein